VRKRKKTLTGVDDDEDDEDEEKDDEDEMEDEEEREEEEDAVDADADVDDEEGGKSGAEGRAGSEWTLSPPSDSTSDGSDGGTLATSFFIRASPEAKPTWPAPLKPTPAAAWPPWPPP